MNPDGHRCEPVVGDDGEVIAVARIHPDASPETRAALRELLEAARRKFAADMAADPTVAERQAEAIRRVRDRNRRLRGES